MRPVDVEGGIADYLAGVLSVPVSPRIPRTRPARFVTVRRIGGVRQNLAQERALVQFWCWGTSETDAFTLAQDTWAAVDAADGLTIGDGVWIAETGLSSPINNNDPDSGQDRYQFTANMVVSLALTV